MSEQILVVHNDYGSLPSTRVASGYANRGFVELLKSDAPDETDRALVWWIRGIGPISMNPGS